MTTTRTFDRDGLTVVATLESDKYGRLVITGLQLTGRPIRAEDLRTIPIGEIEHSAQWPQHESEQIRQRLTPRQLGESLEDFSRRFAEAYRAAAATTPRPASLIARDLGAKLPTVHTWVREARLRGFLPPPDRRKAL